MTSSRPVLAFPHDGKVSRAVFSPDGSLVATGSSDRTARIWTRDGEHLATLRHQSAVNWLVFSDNGRRLWTTQRDFTVRSWIVDDDELIAVAQRQVQPFTEEERKRFEALLDN